MQLQRAPITREVAVAGAWGRLPARSRRAGAVARAQLPEDREPAEQQNQQQQQGAGSSRSEKLFQPGMDFPPVLVDDWRTFRARLVAMETGQAAAATALSVGAQEHWAHPITQPERGCLLVARRPNLGMFSHSIILLLEHSDGEGSSGLVLNMPTPLLISHLGLEEEIADAFGRCPLFIGGPVTKNLLHVLHGRRDVEGSMEILDGIYAGGVESASELVRDGQARPREFVLMAGYSGWGPWQLAHELAEGSWLVVAASQAVIMDCLRESAGWTPGTPGLGGHADDLKRSSWERVLRQAGIEDRLLGI